MRWTQKIKALLLVATLGVAGFLTAHNVFAASTGQIYITPSTATVQNGSNVTVAVRINPGTTVDGAQFTLNFNPSLLKFGSIDASSSPFSVQLQQTSTASSVTVARGQLSGGVSTDSLIANVTFQGLADSGSAALTLTNANATSSGAYTNPSAAGATLTLTPVPVTPPPTGGGGSTGGTGSTGGSTGGSSSSGSSSTPKSTGSGSGSQAASSGGATTTPPQVVTTNGSNSQDVKPQFTIAAVVLQTNVPTQAQVKYGLSKDALDVSTPLSALATTHSVALDTALLIPGTVYYYQVTLKDAQGNATTTQTQSFTTKGYTLRVSVLDKNGHPLRNTTVQLHSVTMTAKTDDKGIATFSDVVPGDHHLVYMAGKKQLSQAVTVNNTVTTDKTSGIQSAPVQNFSVQFPATASSLNVAVPISIIGLLALVAAAFFLRGRFMPQANHQMAAAAVNVPVVSSPAPMPTTSLAPQDSATPAPTNIDQAHGMSTPNPGSVVSPVNPSEQPHDEHL